MRCIRFLLAALLFLPFATQGAGDAPLDRATLRGLKAVNGVLDRVDPKLEKQGLTRNDLQSRLEARLQDAHVTIDQSATDFVALRVTSVRANRGPFGLSFTIGVYQPVVLVRDKNIKTSASTWEVETVVVEDPKTLRQASMETVDELADRFVTAWRSVNSEKPGSSQ